MFYGQCLYTRIRDVLCVRYEVPYHNITLRAKLRDKLHSPSPATAPEQRLQDSAHSLSLSWLSPHHHKDIKQKFEKWKTQTTNYAIDLYFGLKYTQIDSNRRNMK